MKRITFFKGSIAVLGLAISSFSFGQEFTTFDYTGSIETYTVPDGVTNIRIEVSGAQGGAGLDGVVGGLGAKMIGTFAVTGGAELQILVGGEGLDGTDNGQQAGGSGGGGSFVVNSDDDPMIIAGGGAMGRSELLVDGGPGQVSETGQDGGTDGGAGGTLGNGGGTWPWTGWHSGTGGGGFYSDGSADSNGSVASFGTVNGKGKSYLSGGAGGIGGSMGREGGFGGGGAAGFTGGGGGGYSGGGSGTHDSPGSHSGGGGGSFNEGTDQDNTAGENAGNGQIIITELCTPIEVTVTEEEICLGESVTLSGESEGVVSWDGGVVDGEEFTPDEVGVLTYTATSDVGDECPTSIEIEVFALPVIAYTTSDEISGTDGEIDITVTEGAPEYESIQMCLMKQFRQQVLLLLQLE